MTDWREYKGKPLTKEELKDIKFFDLECLLTEDGKIADRKIRYYSDQGIKIREDDLERSDLKVV